MSCKETIIIKKQYDVHVDEYLIDKYMMRECVFVDIECSGFNKAIDKIFSISIGLFKDNKYEVSLYLNLLDEKKLLEEAYDLLNKKLICTFNGKAFDEPFLSYRLAYNNLEDIKYRDHYDLYRILCNYKDNLGVGGCSLTDFEKFLGIHREDEISGKECVSLYRQYLETGDTTIIDIITLHNMEDVAYLPIMFKLINDIKQNNLGRDDMVNLDTYTYIRNLMKNKRIKLNLPDRKIVSNKYSRKLVFELKRKNTNYNVIKAIIDDIEQNDYIYK